MAPFVEIKLFFPHWIVLAFLPQMTINVKAYFYSQFYSIDLYGYFEASATLYYLL